MRMVMERFQRFLFLSFVFFCFNLPIYENENFMSLIFFCFLFLVISFEIELDDQYLFHQSFSISLSILLYFTMICISPIYILDWNCWWQKWPIPSFVSCIFVLLIDLVVRGVKTKWVRDNLSQVFKFVRQGSTNYNGSICPNHLFQSQIQLPTSQVKERHFHGSNWSLKLDVVWIGLTFHDPEIYSNLTRFTNYSSGFSVKWTYFLS